MRFPSVSNPIGDFFRSWLEPDEEATSTYPRPRSPIDFSYMHTADHPALRGPQDRPEPEAPQVSPLEQLLSMFGLGQGGSDRQDVRRQVIQASPYTAQINELRRQIAQQSAQTAQNQADIGSWFGQATAQSSRMAKGNRRAGKKALKSNRREAQGLMNSGMVGDPALVADIARGAADEGRYLRASNQATSAFDRQQIAQLGEQAAYQKLIQDRLGAQAEADMRAQMMDLRGQRRAQVSEAQSSAGDDEFARMMSVLNLLPQETRAQLLGFGQGGDPQEAMEADWAWRDRLGEALSGVSPVVKTKDDFGEETVAPAFGSFQEMLGAYKNAAVGSGLNINDPRVADAYRRYIASYVLSQWNPAAASAGYQGSTWMLDPSNPAQFTTR